MLQTPGDIYDSRLAQEMLAVVNKRDTKTGGINKSIHAEDNNVYADICHRLFFLLRTALWPPDPLLTLHHASLFRTVRIYDGKKKKKNRFIVKKENFFKHLSKSSPEQMILGVL